MKGEFNLKKNIRTYLPTKPFLGGVFKHLLFSPLFGEDSHFDVHIFQRGWFNHQLVFIGIDGVSFSEGITESPIAGDNNKTHVSWQFCWLENGPFQHIFPMKNGDIPTSDL